MMSDQEYIFASKHYNPKPYVKQIILNTIKKKDFENNGNGCNIRFIRQTTSLLLSDNELELTLYNLNTTNQVYEPVPRFFKKVPKNK